MDISLFERDKAKVNLEKPTLNNLALYEVNHTNNTWVTGFNHAPVGINIFDRFALKYMDTCPNIVIEAMAMGLPIIYSKSGGTPEIVGEHAGVGITIQEDWDKIPYAPDPKDIFEAMNKVLDNRVGYSEASRTRAIEKFGIEFWYQRHSYVFESLIDKFEKFI
jgi:glycosyltransferase involved in cell wall biosynthesis